jgi:hypothetical protein
MLVDGPEVQGSLIPVTDDRLHKVEVVLEEK